MACCAPINELLHSVDSISRDTISFFILLHDVSVIMSLMKLLLKPMILAATYKCGILR